MLIVTGRQQLGRHTPEFGEFPVVTGDLTLGIDHQDALDRGVESGVEQGEGAGQFLGAFRDASFESVTASGKRGIALLDLGEHLVKGVGKRANLVPPGQVGAD